MKTEALMNEKESLQDKLQEIKRKVVRKVEKRLFLGLDSDIRQIQKGYALLRRV